MPTPPKQEDSERRSGAYGHHFYIVFYWPGPDGESVSLRCRPFLENVIRFERGEVKTLLLDQDGVAHLAGDSRFDCRLRGDGQPTNESQRRLLQRAEERTGRFEQAFSDVMGYVGGGGSDRSRALLWHTHRTLSKLEIREEMRLPELEILPRSQWQDLRAMAEGVQKVQADLESKGWSFENGRIYEPSTGGRPRLFINGFIRACHKPISILYNYHGRTKVCLEHVQDVIRPFVGDVPLARIREAVRER